jgi:hypothetical protein
MFSKFLAMVALSTFSTAVIGTPTRSPNSTSLLDPTASTYNWTYGDVHTYALGKGPDGAAVASLIEEHVKSAGLGWETVYRDDIMLDNGGVLTLAHSERGRSLAKRQNPPGSNTWLQAFPWVSNCHDWVSFTWAPLRFGCYSYWSGGQNLRMYSARGYVGPSNEGFAMRFFRDVNYCDRGTWYQHMWGDELPGCLASTDGRGWMSFEVVLR